MSTAVDIDALLADALRVLLPLAVKDEPDWLPREGTIERQRAYVAARLALDAYDASEPAVVRSLPSVAQVRPGGSLALVS